jgi:hypothetical protein
MMFDATLFLAERASMICHTIESLSILMFFVPEVAQSSTYPACFHHMVKPEYKYLSNICSSPCSRFARHLTSMCHMSVKGPDNFYCNRT